MELHKLIEADYKKNHASREYGPDSVHKIFDAYEKSGGEYFRTANVVLIYKHLGNKVCEFHCINGGTGKDLTDCINQFFDSDKCKFDRAVTYYDNPRINELSKYANRPAKVTRLDGGLDKTFEMSFDLRST